MKTLTYRKRLKWLKWWVGFSLVAAISSGCDNFISDAIWIQERSIVVSNANIDQCLLSALADAPNIGIDHVHSVSGDIVLSVKLERPIPSLSVYVRHSDTRNVKIMFVGKGTIEAESYRNEITPVLASIVDSIGRRCSTWRDQGRPSMS